MRPRGGPATSVRAACLSCAGCLVLIVGTAVGAESEPAAGSRPPATGEALPETAAPVRPPGPEEARARKVFEYVEELRISRGDSEFQLRSNVLVVVATEGDTVTVRVRPSKDRQLTQEGDPPPGRVTFRSAGAAADTAWSLPPYTVVFQLASGPKNKVVVEGLDKPAAIEVRALLGQGPKVNLLQSEATTLYQVDLLSGGKPLTLRGQQQNARLWMDWTLTGEGTFETGAKGWELPVRFILPKQQLDGRGQTLVAEAALRYSSIRPGPEETTTLTTTLTIPRPKGPVVYTRTCSLRPSTEIVAAESEPPTATLSISKSLGGDAASWARTATLATLGVQPLIGIREAGLAMWVAQATIDAVAGTMVPRVADSAAKTMIADLTAHSPKWAAPPELLEDDLKDGLLRFEAVQNVLRVTVTDTPTTGAPTEDSDLAVVPDLMLALRWKVGRRMRLGAGFEMVWASLDTNEPDEFWGWATLTGRFEYVGKKWGIGLAGGAMMVQYELNSSLRTATAQLTTFVVGLDLERALNRKWSLGLHGQFAGGSDLVIMRAQPTVRWFYRPNVALQFQGIYLSMADSKAVGGEISAEGFGAGLGVAVRW